MAAAPRIEVHPVYRDAHAVAQSICAENIWDSCLNRLLQTSTAAEDPAFRFSVVRFLLWRRWMKHGQMHDLQSAFKGSCATLSWELRQPTARPIHTARYLGLEMKRLAKDKGLDSLMKEAVSLNGTADLLWRSAQRQPPCPPLFHDRHPMAKSDAAQGIWSLCLDRMRVADAVGNEKIFNLSLVRVLLWRRWARNGRVCDLNEAFNLTCSVLASELQSPTVQTVNFVYSLATHLASLAKETGHMRLFGEAISLGALTNLARLHIPQSRYLNIPASRHVERFKVTGDSRLLPEVVHLNRWFIQQTPPGHKQRLTVCRELGVSLSLMFEHTGDVQLLHEGIPLLRESLERGGPMALHQVAVALEQLFRCSGDFSHLDEAIHLEREAIHRLYCWARSSSKAFKVPHWLMLATCLKHRLGSSGASNTVILEEIVDLLTEVARAPPYGRAEQLEAHIELAQWRLRRKGVPVDTYYDPVAALTHLQVVVDSLSIPRHRTFCHLLQALVSIDPQALPITHMAQLLCIYRTAVDRLPLLADVVYDRRARLLGQRSGQLLGERAFECAMRVHDFRSGVEILERARGPFWSQALSLQVPDGELDCVPESVRQELAKLLRDFSAQGEHAVDGWARDDFEAVGWQEIRYAKRDRMEKLVKEVRTVPGLESFMLQPSFDTLCQSISGPVIILATCSKTCHALIMDNPSRPQIHLVLEDITAEAAEEMSVALETELSMRNHTSIEKRALQVSKRPSTTRTMSKMERLLADLWRKVVRPIIQQLDLQKTTGRGRPRVHFLPTGKWTFVPLHAAGVYSDSRGHDLECCSDFFVPSYTPTLLALRNARNGVRHSLVRDLNALCVAEATAPGMPSLPDAEGEVRDVRQIMAAASAGLLPYVGDAAVGARVDAVSAALPQADILHLACHGVQDADDPLGSGFCLRDGKLTVSALMDIRLERAFLAFLSACETAKGDRDQPDQAVHLAAAILFAGFRSVIGTMWSMGDADGPEVARTVYKTLLTGESLQADDVPYALDAAVRMLREQGAAPERWATFVHLGA